MSVPCAARVRTWRFAVGISLLVCSQTPCRADGGVIASPAELFRRDYGLIEAAVGRIWLLERERSLRESITTLGKLRTRVVAGTKASSDLVQRNAKRWEADRGQRERLRKQRAQLRSDDPENARLSKQLQRLRQHSVPPNELPSLPEAQRIAIDLTRSRDRLTLQVAALKRETQQLLQEYKVLGKDERVQRLLKQAGKSHRLGPTQDFTRLLNGIEECTKTNFVPIFDQSGHIRFSGIVNDRAPLTFTWAAAVEVPLVPARLVESARIDLDGAHLRRRRLASGRQVEVRRTHLDRLRFGDTTLENVMVDLLPPDAEDVGAVIGGPAFPDINVELRPATLRLNLSPAGPSQ